MKGFTMKNLVKKTKNFVIVIAFTAFVLVVGITVATTLATYAALN